MFAVVWFYETDLVVPLVHHGGLMDGDDSFVVFSRRDVFVHGYYCIFEFYVIFRSYARTYNNCARTIIYQSFFKSSVMIYIF